MVDGRGRDLSSYGSLSQWLKWPQRTGRHFWLYTAAFEQLAEGEAVPLWRTGEQGGVTLPVALSGLSLSADEPRFGFVSEPFSREGLGICAENQFLSEGKGLPWRLCWAPGEGKAPSVSLPPPACNCHPGGSVSKQTPCDPVTGQCACLPHVAGRDCSHCLPGFYDLQPGGGCRR